MAGIIWFVVVMYIVIRCVSVSKQKNGQAKRNVPRKAAQTDRRKPVQADRGAAAAGQRGYSQPRQTQMARPVQQTKRREPAQQNEILQKAKENATKQFSDDTLKTRGSADLNRVPHGEEIVRDKAQVYHIHSEHESDHGTELQNQPGVDDFDTYHLIDEVNDLIVKGYSGNLEFERDFLAEATDMLNRMYG